MPLARFTNSPGAGVAALFRFLASLKAAIPLIVLLIATTVIGSLFPRPELFSSWWYLGLLGLLGLSLLFITIRHIPYILRRKGRNAMIGVVAIHTGIIMLLVGAVYGNLASSRFSVRAVEGEMTVVPGLPFVLRLEQLRLEDYPPETWSHVSPEMVPKKKQESRITLFKGGQKWLEFTTSPGRPVHVDGYKILPKLADFGWYFELLVTDQLGREQTIPVKPWAPPLIVTGSRNVMVHGRSDGDSLIAQVFTIENEQMIPLGIVSPGSRLELDGNLLELGAVKRYTGLAVYSRPHAWVLLFGSVLLMVGLVWHFYCRHREQRMEGQRSNRDV